jgi:4-alpha-glucanotransferase
MVLKSHFQEKIWSDWPEEVRDRQPKILMSLKRKLRSEIEKVKFLQYIFHRQWKSLKDYSNLKKIHIIGDLPIYVDYDSADVWSHPELFKLDQRRKPYVVAGVPPDYFSETGQRWGNPIYRWDVLQENDYRWWIQRLEQSLKQFDIIRLDHLRGFVGYWEIPAKEKTALNGLWVEAPAVDFFSQIKKRFRPLPIIAEDLGTITDDVRAVMKLFSFPGMKVLLFAFGEDDPMHPYLPHTYEKNCVVYTGTHDNNTVRGRFDGEAGLEEKKRVFRYLGRDVSGSDIHWEFVKLAMMSKANTAIIPMQDILGLGEEARMNRPATRKGNWKWRLLPEQLTSSLAKKLLEITALSGRAEKI